ncbi:MAG: hypothetical protein AAGA66_10185 [Bacteroidota bacterium]
MDFFSQPLINFKDYPISGLVFNGVGCLFWVVAYAVLVWEIVKRKFVEMPAYVACANIGWEFVWSFFFHPNTGLLFSLSYQAAFLLDCFIFYSVLKYGTKQPMTETIKKHFKFLCVANLIFWVLLSYFYRQGGYDTMIGANSGYIINVPLSLLCLLLFLQMKEASKFSLLFAWSRMLGTGLITVSMFIFYPENRFIQLLGVTCFIVDCLFIYLRSRTRSRLTGLANS